MNSLLSKPPPLLQTGTAFALKHDGRNGAEQFEGQCGG